MTRTALADHPTTTAPPPGAPEAREGFLAAFRGTASSVWVITTAVGDRPVGFTAISVASVSLAPPLLSFNASLASSSLPALRACGRYAAHLLAGDQEDLARRFAGDAAQRFDDPSSWAWAPDGLPVLVGCAARLHGAVVAEHRAGDSVVLIGSVDGAGAPDAAPEGPVAPLVHRARRYSAAA